MTQRHIDLRGAKHPNCPQCDRKTRAEWTDGGICQVTTSVRDGLPVRCVGSWAYDKIFHLYQYFGIFAQGMQHKWSGLNYIEICCGPGRCILKETGEEIDGSALAILNHQSFNFIKAAVFVDHTPAIVDALNSRINALGKGNIAKAVVGDYTDIAGMNSLISELPSGHLNLVFIDPNDCSVPFETVAAIIRGLRNVDLIINLPIYMDAGRNLAKATLDAVYEKSRAKYEEFLGIQGFFDDAAIHELATRSDHKGLRAAYRDAYVRHLADYGHQYTAARPIQHLYELVFASSNPKGLEFWDKACRIAPDGQRELL